MDSRADTILKRILYERIVAVVRLDAPNACIEVAEALRAGGVKIIEIAMTTPGALDVMNSMREEFPDLLVGAGSVLTEEDVDACAEAGAEFQVAPVFNPSILAYALERGIVFSPGVFTPSEAYSAWSQGAQIVKVFPAARLGAKFISDLKAPMPFLRLMPTGGVSRDTIVDFLQAGADVVGAGSWLVDKQAIRRGDFGVITDKARALACAVQEYGRRTGVEDGASG